MTECLRRELPPKWFSKPTLHNFKGVLGITIPSELENQGQTDSTGVKSKFPSYLWNTVVIAGLTTIFFEWPLLIAVLHNGGAAGLVLAAVTLRVRLATAGRPALRSLATGHEPEGSLA